MNKAHSSGRLDTAEFINWLADRLVKVHGEDENTDFIVRARQLAAAEFRTSDDYDGAMADLDSALEVLARRINGKADLNSAAEWFRLNYPTKAAEMLRHPWERAIRTVPGQTFGYIAMCAAAVICAGCALWVAFVDATNLAGCIPQ